VGAADACGWCADGGDAAASGWRTVAKRGAGGLPLAAAKATAASNASAVSAAASLRGRGVAPAISAMMPPPGNVALGTRGVARGSRGIGLGRRRVSLGIRGLAMGTRGRARARVASASSHQGRPRSGVTGSETARASWKMLLVVVDLAARRWSGGGVDSCDRFGSGGSNGIVASAGG